MSAENVINSYLTDSESVVTLESLQQYVQEGISIKPLETLVSMLKQLTNFASINKLFSDNKSIVRSALNKSVKAVDDDLFSENVDIDKTEHTHNNPVNTPAPINEKQADGYLKKLYLYFKGFIKGLKFPDIKDVYKGAYTIITKLLIGTGMVLTSMVTAYIAIPAAIMVVVMCMLNAVEQTKDITDENSRIDIKSAFSNVMSGFKRMITSLTLEKGQGKFAIISVIISGTLLWIKHNMGEISSKLSTFLAKASVQLAKGPDIAREIVKMLEGVEIQAIKDIKSVLNNMLDKIGVFSEQQKNAIAYAFKHFKEQALAQGKTEAEADTIAAQAVTDKIQEYLNLDKIASKTTKVIYIGLVVAGVATILYLFAEMVDNFNLKKIKNAEDDREEFEKIS